MVNYNSSQFETTQSGTQSCTFSIELKRQEDICRNINHHKAMGNTEEAREILAKLIKMEEDHVMN